LGLINRLEISALVAFDYNIGISKDEWNQWLIDIRAYHSSLARFQPISRNLGTPYALVRQLMDDTILAFRIHQDTRPGREEEAVKMFAVRDAIRYQNSPMSPRSEGSSLGISSVSAPPLQCQGTPPIDLPCPAPWCPEADPIVFKASRTICTAPGIRRVQKPFMTMSTYAVDNMLAPQALTYVVDMLAWRGEQ